MGEGSVLVAIFADPKTHWSRNKISEMLKELSVPLKQIHLLKTWEKTVA